MVPACPAIEIEPASLLVERLVGEGARRGVLYDLAEGLGLDEMPGGNDRPGSGCMFRHGAAALPRLILVAIGTMAPLGNRDLGRVVPAVSGDQDGAARTFYQDRMMAGGMSGSRQERGGDFAAVEDRQSSLCGLEPTALDDGRDAAPEGRDMVRQGGFLALSLPEIGRASCRERVL